MFCEVTAYGGWHTLGQKRHLKEMAKQVHKGTYPMAHSKAF